MTYNKDIDDFSFRLRKENAWCTGSKQTDNYIQMEHINFKHLHEELKTEVSFSQFIRITESLQAAVEKIPIRQAFDELDSDRDYYQEKRKEANDRLIARKSMIGKAVGFAPMICLFVGYLIVPLVFIGMTSMSTSMNSAGSMT